MTRGILTRWILLSCFAACVGCSGSSKSPKNADDADSASEEMDGEGKPRAADKDLTDDDVEQKGVAQKGSTESKEPKSPSNSVKDNPDPEFKEGGSVEEAIKAVPQGLPRENLELDELNEPLNKPETYAACKLTPSSHFEIKFAVWAGRCVGMDIKTTPKNPKLETCLREVVSQAKWRDKTKSLNISTVSF